VITGEYEGICTPNFLDWAVQEVNYELLGLNITHFPPYMAKNDTVTFDIAIIFIIIIVVIIIIYWILAKKPDYQYN